MNGSRFFCYYASDKEHIDITINLGLSSDRNAINGGP